MKARTVLVLIAAGGLSAAFVAAAMATNHPRAASPFRITRVVTPTNLVANGPDRPERIYWAGHAKFPITIKEEVRSCQPGLICNPVTTTFMRRTDPLVWPKAWHCQGTVPAGFAFRFKTWLVDSAGRQTPKVPINVPCTNP